MTDDEGVTETDYATVEIISAACLGDVEPDGDINGRDLAAYLLDKMGISMVDFAANYGKVNCQ